MKFGIAFDRYSRDLEKEPSYGSRARRIEIVATGAVRSFFAPESIRRCSSCSIPLLDRDSIGRCQTCTADDVTNCERCGDPVAACDRADSLCLDCEDTIERLAVEMGGEK